MSYETLIYEVDNSIAMVTLNRPQVLHALNTQVFDELEKVFANIERDQAVRVVLLMGAGEKAGAGIPAYCPAANRRSVGKNACAA